MAKLLEIKSSSRKDKKYMALFQTDEGKQKKVHFGAKGMMDYIHYYAQDPVHAEERKRLYIIRHGARENHNDPFSPGALSLYILWNRKTLEASIADYKKKFHL